MRLAWAFTGASFVWMLLLIWTASPAGAPAVGLFVHAFASAVCHQEIDRSFAWGPTTWAVCARCLGLYAAAPAGALAAFARAVPWSTSSHPQPGMPRLVLAAAAVPTAATWLAEHAAGAAVGNGTRFFAALPLGAAIGWVLVCTLIGGRSAAVSQYTLKDARRGPTR